MKTATVLMQCLLVLIAPGFASDNRMEETSTPSEKAYIETIFSDTPVEAHIAMLRGEAALLEATLLTPPGAPTGLTVSGGEGDSPHISWNSVSGAYSYTLYSCYYDGGDPCSGYYDGSNWPDWHGAYHGTATSHIDTRFEVSYAGPLVYYYVTAENTQGEESAPSSKVSIPAIVR